MVSIICYDHDNDNHIVLMFYLNIIHSNFVHWWPLIFYCVCPYYIYNCMKCMYANAIERHRVWEKRISYLMQCISQFSIVQRVLVCAIWYYYLRPQNQLTMRFVNIITTKWKKIFGICLSISETDQISTFFFVLKSKWIHETTEAN